MFDLINFWMSFEIICFYHLFIFLVDFILDDSLVEDNRVLFLVLNSDIL